MRKINFKKLKAGELVEVPRYCFAPLRRGWNGWLFSPAVVLTKGISKKSGKEVVKVKMMIPRGTNEYSTVEKTFYSDCVFIWIPPSILWTSWAYTAKRNFTTRS